MKVEKTQRGFEIVQFKDLYNEDCSLQQSSLAIYEQPGSGAIWFGVKKGNNRMHLSYEQVKELIPLLQNWVETGSFEK